MAIDAPIHVNEANLPRVLAVGLPVALVFWRRDHAPSERLMPLLDRLARTYAGKALIVKINATDEPALVRRYAVNQLPTLVFVKGGQTVERAVGEVEEQELVAWLDYLVAGGARPPAPRGSHAPAHEGAAPGTAAGRPTDAPRAAAGVRNGQPITLTDATFEQTVRNSQVPVLVDFWAEWCGPCKMIAPAVAALAREFAGRAVVAKLNVDDNPHTAGRFGIMSIPTLLIFKNGQVVDRIVGAQPAQALHQRLARHVG